MEEALAATEREAPLNALHSVLEREQARTLEPMTVAIVGRIKAGKSTLANAFFSEELVPSAATICTFNVNVFRYGDHTALFVHYKDGSVIQRSLSELAILTRYTVEGVESLSKIDFVEIFHPSPLLKRFSLVDTPGLDSTLGSDEENTLRYLGLRVEDVHRRTVRETRKADAVLYLFARSVSGTDEKTLKDFEGPAFGYATPINAIGVLTKAQLNWKSVDDPLARAVDSCAALLEEPGYCSDFLGSCQCAACWR